MRFSSVSFFAFAFLMEFWMAMDALTCFFFSFTTIVAFFFLIEFWMTKLACSCVKNGFHLLAGRSEEVARKMKKNLSDPILVWVGRTYLLASFLHLLEINAGSPPPDNFL